MRRRLPEWFVISEESTPQVMQRVAQSVSNLRFQLQVRSAPMLAHWFLLNTLLIANQANRKGMHANAIALTRQCVEALGIVELGLCGHSEAETTLIKWESDKLNPGNLRAWLQANVWPQYGSGMWTEPWSTFMREFASALQPYAHYGPMLAQWQERFHGAYETHGSTPAWEGLIELSPRAYDPQKATRITLFHAILSFVLGRIWVAANPRDQEFASLINRLRAALAKSRYLDGHQTNWSQQFWTMVWNRDGGTILE
jgi:hypothetical protein